MNHGCEKGPSALPRGAPNLDESDNINFVPQKNTTPSRANIRTSYKPESLCTKCHSNLQGLNLDYFDPFGP